MGAQKRQPYSSIVDRLLQEFYRFSFFKAVHLLEVLSQGRRPIGGAVKPAEEPVRFSVKPGFVCPPSDISSLTSAGEEEPVKMTIPFLGLIGPSGLLPNWYNEMAIEKDRKNNSPMADFFDVFHHRLISLFYLAWKKYRFPENYEVGGDDRLSGYLMSLIGLGTPGLHHRIGLPEESLIFYCGLLARPVASAEMIEAAATYLSGVPASIDPFIERMLLLSEEDRTQVGMANSRLGEDTVCGSYFWERQTKFRVKLGPMPYNAFRRFLPTGDLFGPVISLVRYMVGIEYEFEIWVILEKEAVPNCVLGDDASPSLLGWSAWTKHPEYRHPEDPYVTF